MIRILIINERVGNFETTLGHIMNDKDASQTGVLKLKGKNQNKSRGRIILRCQEVPKNNNICKFTVNVHGLSNLK